MIQHESVICFGGFLWSPYGIGQTIIFSSCGFFLLVHGQMTIMFVVSVGLSVCLFVQSFSQPSLI